MPVISSGCSEQSGCHKETFTMLFGHNNTERAQCLIEKYKEQEEKRYYFPLLYSALGHDPTPEHIRFISREADNMIFNKDAFFVASLMHSYSNEAPDCDPQIWEKHCEYESGYHALLICGSAHPNGYFREKCLKLLAGHRKTLSYILIRMNDWVPAVRRTAWEVLLVTLRKVSVSEIIYSMPYVEYVRRGRRVQRDECFSMETLDHMLMQIVSANKESVLHYRLPLRKLCYKLFILHPCSSNSELMLCFISREKDGEQRLALVRSYLKNEEYTVTDGFIERAMQDSYWRVRLEAYEYRMKHSGMWDGIEKLLFSQYYPIRQFAAYYLEKNGFDCVRFCRENLPDTLLALSDTGASENIPFVRPYLETRPVQALTTLVRLDAKDSRELVWECINSDDTKLAKTAYRLAQTQIHFTCNELLPRIKEENDPVIQWRLIRLLRDNDNSELMPVLIRMVRDYPHIMSDIIELIKKMCGYSRSGYHGIFVTQKQHKDIEEALRYANNYIPLDLNNYIILHMRDR